MKLSHLLVGGFLLIGILIIVNEYYTFTESRTYLEHIIVDDARAYATNTMQATYRRLTTRINQFELITYDEPFQRALNESNQQFEHLSNIQTYITDIDQHWNMSDTWEHLKKNQLSYELLALMKRSEITYGFPLIAEMMVTNKYGALVAATQKTTDYRQDDEAWWQQAAQFGAYLEGVEYDQSIDIYSVSISTSIENERGEFIGVLKVVFYLTDIARILADAARSLPPESSLKWVTNDGRVIYSSAPFTFMEYDPESKYITETEYYRITDEKLIIHTHSEVQNAQWNILYETDASYAFAPITALRHQLIITSLIILLFSTTIALFITRKTLIPIINIKRAIDDISKGNFDVTLATSNIDELKELADSTRRILTTLKIAVKRVGIKREDIFEQAITAKEETERKYQLLFESSSDAILLAEIDTLKIVDCNKKAEQLLRRSRSEIINMPVEKMYLPEYRQDMQKRFEQYKNKESITNEETEIVTKDNQRIPVNISATPIAIGGKRYVYSSFRPIHELKELQKYTAFFKTSFGNAPYAMELTDYKNKEPHLIQVNKQFTKLYGYTEKEVLDKNPRILKSGKQDKAFYKKLWTDITNPHKGQWEGTVINKTKKDRFVTVRVSIVTIFEQKQPKYFIASHIPIPDKSGIETQNTKTNIYKTSEQRTSKKRTR